MFTISKRGHGSYLFSVTLTKNIHMSSLFHFMPVDAFEILHTGPLNQMSDLNSTMSVSLILPCRGLEPTFFVMTTLNRTEKCFELTNHVLANTQYGGVSAERPRLS